MTPTDSKDEFVMVAIPARIYTEVIQFVAGRTLITTGGPATPPAAAKSIRDMDDWSKEDLAKIALYGNAFTRVVLDLCSERPGQWVTYPQALEKAGLKSTSARAQLAGLTKLIGRLFSDGKPVKGPSQADRWRGWPFRLELIPGGRRREWGYRVRDVIAQSWLEVRSDSQRTA